MDNGFDLVRASALDGTIISPYVSEICQVLHMFFPGAMGGEARALTLDVFQSHGADFEETYFWVSDDQTTWDFLDDNPSDTASLFDETLPFFHCWSLDKNQNSIRRGVAREESMIISADVPPHLLRQMHIERSHDQLWTDPLRSLHLAIGHIEDLGWVHIILPEWEMDASLLLVSNRNRDKHSQMLVLLSDLSWKTFMLQC